jgi:ABC-type sulfate/molybdate transport systems ATPase subunit
MMGEHLLGLDLVVAYGGRTVLGGVRVAIAPGRVAVLVGPSGAGKTTLLWTLAGLLRPESGRVVLGEPPDGGAAARPVDYRRARIGMVFQTPALWDHLSAEGHLGLVLAGRGLGRAERRRRIDRMLERMRLAHLRGRRPAHLSGGERQRLAIARALVTEPDWLLLDEPLAHLDGPARDEVFDLLRGALAGTRAGVLLATHDTGEALRLAEDFVVLLDGVVAQAGPAEEVYGRPASLAVARTLGPADEISGEAKQGVLNRDGIAALEGLPADLVGPERLILRPEDVAFRPDPAGPARVTAAQRACGGWHLRVEAAGAAVWAHHAEPCPPGAAGRLVLVRRG